MRDREIETEMRDRNRDEMGEAPEVLRWPRLATPT